MVSDDSNAGPPTAPGGDSTPPGDPRDDRPHSFPWHASRALDRFGSIPPFALVALLTSLLRLENVARALEGTRGVSINLEFALPTPLETLVLPLEGTGPENAVRIGLVPFLYAAIAAVLAAIYVGGLDRRLRGEPARVVSSAAAYGPRFFAYHLLVYGAVAALVPFALVSPAALLLAPVSSLVRSPFVSAGGPAVLLALVVAVPLALALTATSVSFVRELIETEAVERRA